MFTARTHARPDYSFGSLGGRFILLVFLPKPGPEREAAERALEANRSLFEKNNRLVFCVVRDAEDFEAISPPTRDRRYFHDVDGEIAAAYMTRRDDGSTAPQWILIDPAMRIINSWPIEAAAEAFAQVEVFDDPETHAGAPMHAPVLIVPRVFEPEFCRRLIDVYTQHGGFASGVMRDVGGKTVGVVDDFKKRRDAYVEDVDLQRQVQRRIARRLIPQIEKAFMFKATRLERYLVARYDADDGGYFRPHRDNTTLATTHRQFACSINLNAEEFEGGDLRFPEFGARTYRPPTGGAVIFSCSLLHEATPVTAGTRYAFLPFLYDEASAKIRKENVAHLDPAHIQLMAEQLQQKRGVAAG
jgi:predicted 2-oxoglutarate/Fe(II)-dependent dioxygenase YbiX